MTTTEDVGGDRLPTYEDLVARVEAIDERVDMLDRLLFEDDGAERATDDASDSVALATLLERFPDATLTIVRDLDGSPVLLFDEGEDPV